MKSKKVARNHVIAFAVSASLALFAVMPANAETFNSVSHFHQVEAVGNKVFFGTHEGLYELVGSNNMKMVGTEIFDVMGLAAIGMTLYASGHPSQSSVLPSPVGLIASVDLGKKWKQVSLAGKVDFHFLEGAGKDLYGADSGSGNLMYSSNLGKSWRTLGKNKFSDIAVLPQMSGMAIAIQGKELVLTEDAFKSSERIKTPKAFSQIELTRSGLFALSGDSLYQSKDLGKTWKKISSFTGSAGILSANDQIMLVTVGANILVSSNAGNTFKKVS
jgi:photosystem II stability/assembly factor-like uncharacterized protein